MSRPVVHVAAPVNYKAAPKQIPPRTVQASIGSVNTPTIPVSPPHSNLSSQGACMHCEPPNQTQWSATQKSSPGHNSPTVAADSLITRFAWLRKSKTWNWVLGVMTLFSALAYFIIGWLYLDWTARKDFIEYCQSLQVRFSL
jgi:hypothetical protein